MLSLVFILFVLQAIVVDLSHFLGGTITWSPASVLNTGTSVSIIISQTYSKCITSNIANGAQVPVSSSYNGMTNTLDCISSCPSVVFGRRFDTVNVDRTSDYMVAFTGTAWRPLATSTAAAWSIAARLNVKSRADNNLCNTAPVTNMMSPNCTIVITDAKSQDWFAVAIMFEDFISTFIISPPTCQRQPRIIELPIEQSCIPITVEQTFTSRLVPINDCGSNVNISDIATFSLSGMVQSNIIRDNLTNYCKALTWSSTVFQIGFQVMCAMAVDT
ncbi:unnamed protein product [Rotaria magnacalcarata]|uniref:Uncharacterized protein n=1 Tax=Rotaria magnacalcarata TaxID=392030 RepID=A0A819V1F4_9BILA|nr:unnamed protein product [Rotaria magnacalcarata]CAF4090777.1 unnamed protein product [Rotaria magnacalcarata]